MTMLYNYYGMAGNVKKKNGFKMWLTIITAGLLIVTIYFAWPEIIEAWGLMGKVNIWIFLLLIPVQILSYYAIGGLIFSYLEAKKKIPGLTRWRLTRISLELNFVNHIIPSGGVVGFTYLSWILKDFGVSAGRATMSQIIRFLLTFVSFVVLMLFALIWMVFDHQVSRQLVIMCAILAFATLMVIALFVWALGSREHLNKFTGWFVRAGNLLVKIFTFGRKKNIVKRALIDDFFDDIYNDYQNIRREKKILWKPFIWAITAQMADVALYVVAFWALGYFVNPAVLLLGMGLSSLGAVFSVTPAGAGVVEALMVGFLVSTGTPLDVAFAGTLLARVTLVAGTIIFGYFFYQSTVAKHGNNTPVQR